MIEYLGAKLSLVIGGLAGTLVGTTLQKDISMKERVIAILSGTVSSIYVTPVLAAWLGFPQEVENGMSFLIGLFGMNIVRLVMNMKSIKFGGVTVTKKDD